MMRIAAASLLLGLAACVPAGPQPSVSGPASWTASLPAELDRGAGDPARAALSRSSFAFSRPGRFANNPADAARAIADVEYLAVELAGPRWVSMPMGATQLTAARPEWRQALGIAPGAPPQAVIDQLHAARRALMAGAPDQAAAVFHPGVFSAGAGTLNRLAALPPLPQTAAAVINAEREATQAAFGGRSSRRVGRR